MPSATQDPLIPLTTNPSASIIARPEKGSSLPPKGRLSTSANSRSTRRIRVSRPLLKFFRGAIREKLGVLRPRTVLCPCQAEP